MSRKGIHRDLPRAGDQEWKVTRSGLEGTFGFDEKLLKLVRDDSCMSLSIYLKIIVYLQWVNFMICKLYLDEAIKYMYKLRRDRRALLSCPGSHSNTNHSVRLEDKPDEEPGLKAWCSHHSTLDPN